MTLQTVGWDSWRAFHLHLVSGGSPGPARRLGLKPSKKLPGQALSGTIRKE